MIESYLIDTVTILRRTLDEWGEPGTATATAYRARIDLDTKTVRSPEGEIVVAGGVVILPSTADVRLADRIVLAAVSGTADPEDEHAILRIVTDRDFAARAKRVYIE